MWRRALTGTSVGYVAARFGVFGHNKIQLEFPMDKEHRVSYEVDYQNYLLCDGWRIEREVDNRGVIEPVKFDLKGSNIGFPSGKHISKDEGSITRYFSGLSIRPCHIVASKRIGTDLYDKTTVLVPNTRWRRKFSVLNSSMGYPWFSNRWRAGINYLKERLSADNRDIFERYDGELKNEDVRNEYEYATYRMMYYNATKPVYNHALDHWEDPQFMGPIHHAPVKFQKFKESIKEDVDKIMERIEEQGYVCRKDVKDYMNVVKNGRIY